MACLWGGTGQHDRQPGSIGFGHEHAHPVPRLEHGGAVGGDQLGSPGDGDHHGARRERRLGQRAADQRGVVTDDGVQGAGSGPHARDAVQAGQEDVAIASNQVAAGENADDRPAVVEDRQPVPSRGDQCRSASRRPDVRSDGHHLAVGQAAHGCRRFSGILLGQSVRVHHPYEEVAFVDHRCAGNAELL